ncbi:MAG: hypothetical protein A2542_02645 [Parcubacteria group bacterium RIFOXYD2_FULL_52_8]|nr:MAG: hypothetical protein A2542_02645 [Parcubacteria group bacterium RIFOXYD2_FULL_52_8]
MRHLAVYFPGDEEPPVKKTDKGFVINGDGTCGGWGPGWVHFNPTPEFMTQLKLDGLWCEVDKFKLFWIYGSRYAKVVHLEGGITMWHLQSKACYLLTIQPTVDFRKVTMDELEQTYGTLPEEFKNLRTWLQMDDRGWCTLESLGFDPYPDWEETHPADAWGERGRVPEYLGVFPLCWRREGDKFYEVYNPPGSRVLCEGKDRVWRLKTGELYLLRYGRSLTQVTLDELEREFGTLPEDFKS